MAQTLSNTTTDHETIKKWAEERGGWPAEVEDTGREGETGIIRIDFPGFSGEGKLRRISWDEWFEKFDAAGLAFVYEETTAAGERSSFNELVARETTAARARGARSSRRGVGRKRAGGSSRRAGAPAKRAGGSRRGAAASSRGGGTSSRRASSGRSAGRPGGGRQASGRGATRSTSRGRGAATGTRSRAGSSSRKTSRAGGRSTGRGRKGGRSTR